MATSKLTARQVQVARDGDHSDGGGLVLRVKGDGASWVLRYTSPTEIAHDKSGNIKYGKDGTPLLARREQGLGVCRRSNITEAGKSLTAARELAEGSRKLLRSKVDPIEHGRAQRESAQQETAAKKAAAKAQAMTLARCARAYHEKVIEPVKSPKYAANWIGALERHVPAAIWHAPVASITPQQFLDLFLAVRLKHDEIGGRIVQRLVRVIADAEFRGHMHGNAAHAAAKALRDRNLPTRQVVHHKHLPYAEVPAFMAELAKREAFAALALRFAVLTAARTGEVIGATWAEIDLDAGLWTIPGARMKQGRTHQVPLSTQAVDILRQATEYAAPFVFPSADTIGSEEPQAMSNMAMLTLLRRLDADKRTTVHGLARGTFSTWANEHAHARSDVIETCLAHQERNAIRRAYNHASYMPERRDLLQQWADYCDGKEPASAVVLPMLRAA